MPGGGEGKEVLKVVNDGGMVACWYGGMVVWWHGGMAAWG